MYWLVKNLFLFPICQQKYKTLKHYKTERALSVGQTWYFPLKKTHYPSSRNLLTFCSESTGTSRNEA